MKKKMLVIILLGTAMLAAVGCASQDDREGWARADGELILEHLETLNFTPRLVDMVHVLHDPVTFVGYREPYNLTLEDIDFLNDGANPFALLKGAWLVEDVEKRQIDIDSSGVCGSARLSRLCFGRIAYMIHIVQVFQMLNYEPTDQYTWNGTITREMWWRGNLHGKQGLQGTDWWLKMYGIDTQWDIEEYD